jgi:putative ATP-dependent endonuclease of OLD family
VDLGTTVSSAPTPIAAHTTTIWDRTMKIQSFKLQHYRSASNVDLQDCGQFNVLIGKNNSGKSTILSALHGFFATISDGGLVTLEPAFGKRIDFHNAIVSSPIEVSVTFLLTNTERESLVAAIVAEAAQMKNAAEGLPTTVCLTATLRVSAVGDERYAYVSDLLLEDVARMGDKHARYTLVSISAKSAAEIVQRRIRIRDISTVAEAASSVIEGIDQDDWERIRSELSNERRPSGSPFRYIMRHFYSGELPEEAMTLVASLLREEKTYDEFRRSVTSFIESLTDERATLEKQALTNPLDTFSGNDAHIPAYVDLLISRISEMRVHYLTDRRTPIGNVEADHLLDLKVRRGGVDELRNIQETVTSLLGVSIDAYQADNASATDRVAELDVDEFLVEANGSGIREALRLILDVEFSNPAVVLVEEPELHLHPGLETSMMRYLKRKSNQSQVFLTTHSTNFLDTADMSKVYLVSKLGGTFVRMLKFEDAESQIPKELGIKLSSLFMFDRLVFVEGASDENVLRECASKLGINLSQANVGFVQIGGSRNFLYFATEATLSFLKRRGVAMWFILDRDERDAVEVEKVKTLLGDRAKVIVLARRELENYLICPRAIASFVNAKAQLAGVNGERTDVNEQVARQSLQDAADELRPIAIQKRVARVANRPVYPRFVPDRSYADDNAVAAQVLLQIDEAITQLTNVKGRVAALVEDERKNVETEWSSKCLDIIPGDELLDVACQKMGARFHKQRDGVRLASLMSKDEIPTELQSILREIGAHP